MVSYKTLLNDFKRFGKVPSATALLETREHYGWSIAHELARLGIRFYDFEVLCIEDEHGWTVAHEQAKAGYKFQHEEILAFKDNKGVTVMSLVSEGLFEPLENDQRLDEVVLKLSPQQQLTLLT